MCATPSFAECSFYYLLLMQFYVERVWAKDLDATLSSYCLSARAERRTQTGDSPDSPHYLLEWFMNAWEGDKTIRAREEVSNIHAVCGDASHVQIFHEYPILSCPKLPVKGYRFNNIVTLLTTMSHLLLFFSDNYKKLANFCAEGVELFNTCQKDLLNRLRNLP